MNAPLSGSKYNATAAALSAHLARANDAHLVTAAYVLSGFDLAAYVAAMLIPENEFQCCLTHVTTGVFFGPARAFYRNTFFVVAADRDRLGILIRDEMLRRFDAQQAHVE